MKALVLSLAGVVIVLLVTVGVMVGYPLVLADRFARAWQDDDLIRINELFATGWSIDGPPSHRNINLYRPDDAGGSIHWIGIFNPCDPHEIQRLEWTVDDFFRCRRAFGGRENFYFVATWSGVIFVDARSGDSADMRSLPP